MERLGGSYFVGENRSIFFLYIDLVVLIKKR